MFSKEIDFIRAYIEMKKINFDELETFLIEGNKLFMEAELISKFYPDIKIYNISKVELYHLHFTIFHHLFKLKPIIKTKGLNLQIHFMRIGIVGVVAMSPSPAIRRGDVPIARNLVEDSENNCTHQQLEKIDSLAEFYLDETNYNFFSEEILENWYKSTLIILKNNDYYKEALEQLDLKEPFALNDLKHNYRKLAKLYHPDLNQTNTSDHQKFLDVNRAYQFLLKCVID